MCQKDSIFGTICFVLVVFAAIMGVVFGYDAGVNKALLRVCNQTKGKYDFCKPVPHYEVIWKE